MRMLLACLCIVVAGGVAAAPPASPVRQAEVRERGTDVMPFSLDKTIHVFEKNEQGGVQRVSARRGHAEQVPAIRAHLKDIADAFTRRDFSAPSHIHGDDMPGLAELRAASSGTLSVTYESEKNGAQVRYVATTPALRDAIHRWFDAQVSDHGHDAMDHARHHPATQP